MSHDRHRRSPSGTSLFGLVVVSFCFPLRQRAAATAYYRALGRLSAKISPNQARRFPSLAYLGAQGARCWSRGPCNSKSVRVPVMLMVEEQWWERTSVGPGRLTNAAK
ncbi:hypothetical protein F4801DRAFT_558017 [Xylaria longipes]|nr:hypothetical protein F4801DRAFT_558017 [Xylaria longipes]